MKAGWEEKKLYEIAEVFTDGDWIESKDQSSSGIRLIQTGNVGEGFFKNRVEKSRYISQETFKRLKCTEIHEGDCLISRLPDPVGRACLLPDTGEKMITAVDCTIIRFNRNVLPTFFNYFSQSISYQKAIDKEITGTTRNRISRLKLGEIHVPLPPLPEQKRIVVILDKAFAAIAKAKENTERNLSNAKELFESYLDIIDSEKTSLGLLVDIKTGKLDANAAVENGDYPFFTCSREIYKINTFAFDTEAILLAGNNAVGDFNVKHYKGKFNAYQRTYVLTVKNDNKVLYRFLYFQLLKSLKTFKGLSVGAGTKFLKMSMIQNLPIPLPRLGEQKEWLKKLDSLNNSIRELESIYTKTLANLEELKKSFLQKAFNGEL